MNEIEPHYRKYYWKDRHFGEIQMLYSNTPKRYMEFLSGKGIVNIIEFEDTPIGCEHCNCTCKSEEVSIVRFAIQSSYWNNGWYRIMSDPFAKMFGKEQKDVEIYQTSCEDMEFLSGSTNGYESWNEWFKIEALA